MVRLDFDQDEKSWSVTANDNTVTFMTFVDDTHVNMINADGSYTPVELSQEGLMAYRESAVASMWASR